MERRLKTSLHVVVLQYDSQVERGCLLLYRNGMIFDVDSSEYFRGLFRRFFD